MLHFLLVSPRHCLLFEAVKCGLAIVYPTVDGQISQAVDETDALNVILNRAHLLQLILQLLIHVSSSFWRS